MAVTSDGVLRTWGSNAQGRPGDGMMGGAAVSACNPTEITIDATGVNVLRIELDAGFAGLVPKGAPYCLQCKILLDGGHHEKIIWNYIACCGCGVDCRLRFFA